MTIQFHPNGTTSASLAVWMYIVPNETMRCPFPPAPIKPFRRIQTVAPSVNSPSHHATITSAAPLPTSATTRPQTMLTTSLPLMPSPPHLPPMRMSFRHPNWTMANALYDRSKSKCPPGLNRFNRDPTG